MGVPSRTSRAPLLLLLPVIACAAAATTATTAHFEISRAIVANERQFPSVPSLRPMGSAQIKLQVVFDVLQPLLGIKREEIFWLTAFGGEDHGKRFSLNAMPDIFFSAPYLVIDEQQKAAWARDPSAIVITSDIAARNGWKVGDTVTITHKLGNPTGTIVAICEGTTPKVIFHPAQLDAALPEEQRGLAQYVSFPMGKLEYQPAQKAVEDALEKIGSPAWVSNAHDYVAEAFIAAPIPHVARACTYTLSFVFLLVVVTAALAQSAGGSPPMKVLARTLGVVLVACVGTAIAIYVHYRGGGFKAGYWVLESVPVELSRALEAAALQLVGAALALAVVLVARQRTVLVAGLTLAVGAFAVTGVIVVHRSVMSLRESPAETTTLVLKDQSESDSKIEDPVVTRVQAKFGARASVSRFDFVMMRDDNRIVRIVRLRATDENATAVHGASIEGAFPAPGSDGVVVGAALLRTFPDVMKDGVLLGPHRRKVTGVLHAPSTFLDSEVWCNRADIDRLIGAYPAQAITVANLTPTERAELSSEPTLWAPPQSRLMELIEAFRTPFVVVAAAMGLALSCALIAFFVCARGLPGGRVASLALLAIVVGVGATALLRERQLTGGYAYTVVPLRPFR